MARSGFVACVQEVVVTPGELLADADLIHYTMGASEKDEEEAIRKAVDFSATARRQSVDPENGIYPLTTRNNANRDR